MLKAGDVSGQNILQDTKKLSLNCGRAQRVDDSGDRLSSNIETDGLQRHAILPFSIKYFMKYKRSNANVILYTWIGDTCFAPIDNHSPSYVLFVKYMI